MGNYESVQICEVHNTTIWIVILQDISQDHSITTENPDHRLRLLRLIFHKTINNQKAHQNAHDFIVDLFLLHR